MHTHAHAQFSARTCPSETYLLAGEFTLPMPSSGTTAATNILAHSLYAARCRGGSPQNFSVLPRWEGDNHYRPPHSGGPHSPAAHAFRSEFLFLSLAQQPSLTRENLSHADTLLTFAAGRSISLLPLPRLAAPLRARLADDSLRSLLGNLGRR